MKIETLKHLVRVGRPAFLLVALAIVLTPARAQKNRRGAVTLKPDLADVKYGPHERNVLDLWKASSSVPTPLVVFIHGGSFRTGSKEALSPALLEGLLAKGISVMAINYRFWPEVRMTVEDCVSFIGCLEKNAFASATM